MSTRTPLSNVFPAAFYLKGVQRACEEAYRSGIPAVAVFETFSKVDVYLASSRAGAATGALPHIPQISLEHSDLAAKLLEQLGPRREDSSRIISELGAQRHEVEGRPSSWHLMQRRDGTFYRKKSAPLLHKEIADRASQVLGKPVSEDTARKIHTRSAKDQRSVDSKWRRRLAAGQGKRKASR